MLTPRRASATDAASLWFSRLPRYPLLPEEKTLELINQVHAWTKGELPEKQGRKAQEKLILHNLRLVVDVWRRFYPYVRSNEDRLVDLLQSGVAGMMRGTLKFDPSRGWKFSTYIVHWIRSGMTLFITRQARTIRVSERCASSVKKATLFQETFAREHGREPTLQETAAHVKLNPETLASYAENYRNTNVLPGDSRRYLDGEENLTLFDTVSAPVSPSREDRLHLSGEIDRIFDLAGLSEVERGLILHVGSRRLASKERPVTVVAQDMGIDPIKAGVLYREGLKRCRKAVAEEGLSLSAILSQV